MNPRVLFVDHAGVLGGAELYLLDVARAYRSTSSVLLFEEGPFLDRLQQEDIEAEAVPASDALLGIQKGSSLWNALHALPDVLALVAHVAQRAQKYDLIYANSQKALIVSGLASWWTGRPLVWNLHDMLTTDHFSPFNRWIATRWANGFADRVIVNSEATRDAFAESGGRVENTGLVYNGIDATPFDALPADATRSTRRALNLDPDVPVLGVFSRLARWKGQHVLIEALPDIPNAHALLVGEALFGSDAIYKQRLEDTAARLGVRDRVHILGFRDDIPRLMKASDIVVHTSIAPEPFGRVIVEGMLAGRPVIATAAGGALEIVDAGTTGLLVPPGDASALAEAVTDLLTHPEQARTMAEAGRAMVCERFSIETMLTAIDRQINAALSDE